MFLSSVPTAFVLSTFLLVILLLLAGVYSLIKMKRQINLAENVQVNCYEDSYRPLSDAIIILNNNNQFVYLNPAAEEMLGCKLRSMMGRVYGDAFEFKNFKTGRVLHNVIGSSVEKKCECLLATIMNQSFSVAVKYSPIRKYENGAEKTSYLIELKDITKRKAEESRISLLENYDSLTQMRKQKSFEAAIKNLIDNSYKYDLKHVLVFFSIDQFQNINESIGYSGADNLIKTIAETIKKYLKKGVDIVGRVGASEFSVVFRNDSLPAAVRTIEVILKAVENCNFTLLGREYPTTMSAGFVIIGDEVISPTKAISDASVACSVARKHGGNLLYAYKSENAEIKKLEGNLEWVGVLKKAMKENLFQMFAQPIHCLTEDEYKKPYSHYELLIRLFDAKGKPIAPYEFLSAAEYYSMMPAVDRWVVRNSLEQISKIPFQKPLPVFAINLSGQSLNDPRFLQYVLDEVENSGVNPEMLCFEITEQVAVEDISLVNQFIASLKSVGSQFSLDDFGTGISSYEYLRSLDVDYLKIDGGFVKNIDSDEVARSMVQSISQVGHTMGLKIIAEYVENEKILKILREMGVDYGQGYYILKPGPLNEVARHHLQKTSGRS